MVDFGISGTMMDFHNFDEGVFDEFGVEYFRITQALNQAGIDINMLNQMDKARIAAALWVDNTLFEEGGALLAMGRQSYGFMDKMHIDESEEHITANQIGQVVSHYDSSGAEVDEYKYQWTSLSEDEKEAAVNGWLPALIFGKDKPQLYQPVIEPAPFNTRVMGLLAGLNLTSQTIAPIQAMDVRAIASFEPEGQEQEGDSYKWRNFVTQQAVNGAPTQHIEEKGKADSWVETVEEQARRAALREEEVSAAG